MIEKVSTALDFLAREKEVIKFWNDNDIFRKSMKNREGQQVWSFYDGPPTANGKPHIGHIETRAIKDAAPLPHDEGPVGHPQGGLGHPRPAGGAGG